MTVREATAVDAAEIAALSAQLGYPTDTAAIADRLTRAAGRKDSIVLVAVMDGKVAGWLQGQASEVLESGFRAEIVGLIVAESFRRHGVGRRLVERAEQWAAGIGAPAVVVRSNTTRAESHRFYPALGYTPSKTQAVYRKILTP